MNPTLNLYASGIDRIKDTITGDFWEGLQGESIVSWFVMLILATIFIITGIVFTKKNKKEEWKKPDKGLSLIVVLIIEKIDDLVDSLMGKKYEGFGGYVLPLITYIGLSFIVGLMGLPNPMSYFGNTLAIGLCTFLLIHGNAVRANKIKYFHRYIEPMPFMLPINLLSMWAPLLSISLRIFGNALSGYTLMTIVYYSLGNVSSKVFSFIEGAGGRIILPPIITWLLHAYFDAFSGLVQTLIFVMLTCIWVSQEDPDPTLA